ncbi:PhzF family phenazine biosynthesis protein [Hellea balneolensis]|uniref:PhzF family phenazine biosynthesis protein n=1 Tax=Hellea balneolensis TaxID=287478 RepID=UPI0004223998|nr:PhzF family phenazine biosynthesis protein [Hellea balneolensis]
MQFYQVDAFADALFKGNPAAVMKLEAFLSDDMMQRIATENNLSETAYVVPSGDHFKLRWFTPTVEIDFCGHATVATAHVMASEYGLTPPFAFETKVGRLSVDIIDERYVLDAPISRAVPTDVTAQMRAAFPVPIETAFTAGNNLYLVFENTDEVAAIEPDMSKIIPLSDHGVGITAKGEGEYDCVSRFFVPAEGIDEDPVTGSAHAAIGPYWAARLGKTTLKAYQASKRGGILWLEVGKERLTISGHAVTYMKAEITGL